MKVKNTILLTTIATLFTFQIAFAQQTTISFENPVPNAPTTCNDVWFENGIEMEYVKINNSQNCFWFSYSNSGTHFGNDVALKLDLSSIDFISQIDFFIADDPGCYNDPTPSGFTTIDFYYSQNLVTSITSNNGERYPELFTFANNNNLIFDEMIISSSACEGAIIDYISFTYTNDPPCEAEPIVNARSGDVYVDNDCHGVILTSPDGNCFRTRVNNNGTLFAEPVNCP